MPLFPGKKKSTISHNIKEMLNSSTFANDKSEQKRRQMAIAAAYAKSRERKK